MSKVSVIVPIYGVERYIEKCAISLFEQTLDDIEFIFVDDCTQDRSMDILDQVVKKYQLSIKKKRYQVRIEKMLANSGLAAVRKHGIQLASGDYVINCDSDDWVDISMYEKMYNHAINNNSDLVICDYIISNGHKASEKIFNKNITDCSRESVLERLLTSSDLNPVWSAMAKRELFENIMYPIGTMSEDKTFMIQLAWKARKISYLPEALYYYFLSDSSILRNINKESNIKKFKQITDNRYIILNFIDRENIRLSQRLIDSFIFDAKTGLLEPFLDDPECRILWKETFPISLCRILLNPYINIKTKIKYFFTLWKCQ